MSNKKMTTPPPPKHPVRDWTRADSYLHRTGGGADEPARLPRRRRSGVSAGRSRSAEPGTASGVARLIPPLLALLFLALLWLSLQ